MMARGDRRLEAAVALGIISAAQADAIRAINPEPEGDDLTSPEAARPFNAATLAYVLGAITVVVAMGWFLADRWTWLGAGGVLAVSVLYAGLFLLIAHRLRLQGFRNAAGFTVLLAVCMAPVATVALNEVVGWVESASRASCRYPDFALLSCRGEELLAELVTAATALIALRRVRFSLLVLPLAALALRFLFHTGDAIGRNGFGNTTSGWVWVVGASLLAATAYATDRRQRGDEDFALWLHLAAVVAAMAATVILLGTFQEMRHLLIPGAFVAFAAALSIRRLAWLFLGMAWFVWYLGWLASDVFRDSPIFPIVLAALGISVIVVTVWVQRNAARLVARFGSVTSDGRPRFPGGVPLLLSPALVALLMMPMSAQQDRESRAASEWQIDRLRRQAERDTLEAPDDSTTRRREGSRETRPVPPS